MTPILQLSRGILLLAFVYLAAPDCHSAESESPPFVAGFERFGRFESADAGDAAKLLVSELNCVACHSDPRPELQPKRGPNLDGAGNRLQADWLRQYLTDPSGTKPGTTMPDVLHGIPQNKKSETINALAAFLQSQMRPFKKPKAGGGNPLLHEFWTQGNPANGRQLYHSVGCVACHEYDKTKETASVERSSIEKLIERLDPEELEELGLAAQARPVQSIPHSSLPEKYTSRSLTMMLLDPALDRPASRMPSLRLTPDEAADIAAYLLDQNALADIQPDQVDVDLIKKGKALFAQHRCSACHSVKPTASNSAAKPFANLSLNAQANCVSKPSPGIPSFGLDKQQIEFVQKAIADKTMIKQPGDLVRQQMLQLNCYACHQRNEIGGVGRYRKAYFETLSQVDLGDEGRLPPSLTGVGAKLTARALAAVFHPKTPAHRPHMTIRMPSYNAATTATLVTTLPKADGASDATAQEVFGKKRDLAKAGHKLADTGCVGCHPFRGEALPSVVGVDLEPVARLRPAWFKEFLHNPVALKKRTRMPTFFPDGKSNRKDILGGDVDQQIAAIWYYLSDLKDQPLPASIEKIRSQDFELIPKDRAIVLRTFMNEVGTHAIAVGFPARQHYAFDSENSRLALAWRGRFLDAKGTWFERFTPPAAPLESNVIRFPKGPAFLLSNADANDRKSTTPEFKGYRIGKDGTPTMLYQFAGYSIADTLRPTSSGFIRELELKTKTDDRADLMFVAHAGKQLTQVSETQFSDQQKLSVKITLDGDEKGLLRKSGEVMQWLIPIQKSSKTKIRAEYQW